MLPSLHFPLGHLTKDRVRDLARERGLITADKPESQEICFVPTGDYRDLLKNRLDASHSAFEPGAIVTTQGEAVGEHQGFAGFTVGQRKGLPGGFSEAIFVLEIRADTREIVVGTREDLYSSGVVLGELNWLADPPALGETVDIQLRHRAPASRATLERLEKTLALSLEEPQPSVTPGQSGVLFQGDRMLGGGRIVRGLRARR